MADPASTDLVSTLVPVVVGGAIGLMGGWLGPWFLERKKEGAEKKKRRAAKFEELVTALYEHKHWLDMMESLLGLRVRAKALNDSICKSSCHLPSVFSCV